MEDRNDIIITKAGKGGTVVIIDVEDYAKEAEHQLKNKTEPLFYTWLKIHKTGTLDAQ